MSSILSVTYDDCLTYTGGTTLSAAAAGFIVSTAGTLTLTPPNANRAAVSLTVLAGVVYPIAFSKIALGTASGVTALIASPFKGTT